MFLTRIANHALMFALIALHRMLSISAPAGQTALVFAAVFVIVWVGAAVVTINAQLLGGKMYVPHHSYVGRLILPPFPRFSRSSFFQSVCVLGYCVFPMNVVTLACMLVKLVFSGIIWRLILVIIGCIWSLRASVVFMSQMVPEKRKILATYPVFLFYIFIGWLILVQ
jgi:hypothetical protein